MTSENKKLIGKVAIVTGASSGIGKATAIALSKEGAKVALAARRLDKLIDVEKQISELGGTAISVQTDVTKRYQVKHLVEETVAKLGPVDILINNAGCWYWSLMKNMREDLWEEQIDVNIKGDICAVIPTVILVQQRTVKSTSYLEVCLSTNKGLTNCIGAVLDGMVKRKTGHIVNMSSENGKKGFPGLAIYTGTKFFVEGLSQTLRQEVCKLGIRVTSIQPGDVKVEDRAKSYRDPDPECRQLDTSAHIENMMDTINIANAVVYAVTQPDFVAVNEILVQNTEFPI